MTSLTLCFLLLKCQMIVVQVRFTRAFKGLISPPSESPGEIMSFGGKLLHVVFRFRFRVAENFCKGDDRKKNIFMSKS